MLSLFAGFNSPEIMIPVYSLFAVLLSIIIWLAYYLLQTLLNKPLPGKVSLLLATLVMLIIAIGLGALA